MTTPLPGEPPGVLLTDLYQLTMAHAYFEHGMSGVAVFELFVRRLPAARRFLLAAGLEQALAYLEGLRFTPGELEYLRSLGSFPEAFLAYLAQLRFTGTVHAVPEGTPFCADEPILRVTAPILEAQLVESRLLSILHFQTMIASKAARCVIAGRGKPLIDFGMRRAHEADAGLYAARAAYLSGFAATATVEAGRRFGIPVSGTMAHSFIEAHDSEMEAFRHFVASRPQGAILLIDTYDVEQGARRVARLAQELSSQGAGRPIRAVRIDSGDLGSEARRVRGILDAAGCQDIQIVLSGGLDELTIDEMERAGVPADGFGVGTALDVSADAPSLDMVYKLQEYAGQPRRKRSFGKATWPGIKQVLRERDAGGVGLRDTVALESERLPGEPLLIEVMRDGRPTGGASALAVLRADCAAQLKGLPAGLKELAPAAQPPFTAQISEGVRAVAALLDAHLAAQ
jgi:nicotinate phosphoribosyltransferase